jgi:peptide/nickel transport system permease protein
MAASALRRFLDSDIAYSFKRSPLVIVAAVVTLICILAAVFAPWVAPHNPFDLRTLNLLDAFTPPASASAATPTTSSAPTTRAATCSRPSSSARACRW